MRNPLSLEAFADWCERKPADEEYDWRSLDDCAIAQYADFLMADDFILYSRVSCLKGMNGWSAEELACEQPHTFGALAARLREASNATGDA